MNNTKIRVGLHLFCCAILITPPPSLLAAQSGQPVAAPVTRESLIGTYDGGQMEVGARLLLKPDGHFSYELAYGALDEAADGTWEFKDQAVFLTTVPVVVPPRFEVVSDSPEPRGGLWIKLTNGPLMEGARQRVYLIYGPGEPEDMAEVDSDGHVPLPGKRLPTAIIPEIPVYPIISKPIPLTGTGGHRFVLRFEANDIGKADLKAQRLGIEKGELVMPRRDLQLMLRFRRVEGKP